MAKDNVDAYAKWRLYFLEGYWARYGKMGNSQCAQCVLYLSGRNMKTENVSRDTFQKIRVDQISPNPNQARIDFDKAGLVELAESKKATGLLQPIIVKPVDNQLQIIAGERRWRAHQLKRCPSRVDM